MGLSLRYTLALALLVVAIASVQARPFKVAELTEGGQLDKRARPMDCEAYEVHLAVADDESSYRVAWRTYGPECQSLVYYGLVTSQSANELNHTAPRVPLGQVIGTSYTVEEGHMCTAPANGQPFSVTMHIAHIRGLQPDTRYWYELSGSKRDFQFRSPIVPSNSEARPFSFVAYGDMGESKHNKKHCHMASQTVKTILDEDKRSPIDLVVHVGDLSYADGSYKKWDSFMEAVEPIASRIPYMIAIGNHEYDFVGRGVNDPSGVIEPYRPSWGNFGSESGGECGAMTRGRFVMPNVRAATDNAPFWYSYDYGNVHFVMISTEHDISPGSMQYRWLANDLDAVDRCSTPWIVLSMHRPMYVVFPHKSNRVVGDHLKDFVEDLLLEYEVDVTLSGHVHTYYRTCSVRNDRCKEDGSGITHFTIGTAGHTLSGLDHNQEEWVRASIDDYGFVRFDVDGDTMTSRFIRSQDGSVSDKVTLLARSVTAEECNRRRAGASARTAALQERLAALKQQYEQRVAAEKLAEEAAASKVDPLGQETRNGGDDVVPTIRAAEQ